MEKKGLKVKTGSVVHLQWVALNTVAVVVATLLGDAIFDLDTVTFFAYFVVLGLAVASLQWIVIRQLLGHAGIWWLGTCISLLLVGLFDLTSSAYMDVTLLIEGLILGLAQTLIWVVVWDYGRRSVVWLPAVTFTWMLIQSAPADYVQVAIAALVGAFVTGYVLVWLLKDSERIEITEQYGSRARVALLGIIVISAIFGVVVDIPRVSPVSSSLSGSIPLVAEAVETIPVGEDVEYQLGSTEVVFSTMPEANSGIAPMGMDADAGTLMFALAGSSGNGCGRRQDWYIPNGDIVSQVVSLTLLDNFEGACNAHDRCYGTPNASKSTCDKEFMHDLYRACEDTYGLYTGKIWRPFGWVVSRVNPLYYQCTYQADLFVAVVQNSEAAANAFRNAQSSATHTEYIRVHFENACRATIITAINYMNLRDNWVTDGWWAIEPGETAYVAQTHNSILYTYAKIRGEAYEWSGNSGPWRVRDDGLYDFVRHTTGSTRLGGTFTLQFTCSNW